jgi:DNA-directed RNA polymerase specialized sigma24 family protein
MLDDSDTSLVETLRQFGEQKLAEILSASFERLQRIVDLRLDPRLAGRLDAADVVQEAFLVARERLPRFREVVESISGLRS